MMSNNRNTLIKFNNQASPDFLEFVNFTNQCLTQSACQYAYQKGFEQGQNVSNIFTIPDNNRLNEFRSANSSRAYSNKGNHTTNSQSGKTKEFKNKNKDSIHKNKSVNCSICNYQFESSYQGKNDILCKRCMNNNNY